MGVLDECRDGYKLANRKCPICGTTRVQVLHHQVFVLPVGHPLGDGYDVVVCAGCRFVYADTTVSQEDYDRFYTSYSHYADVSTSTGGCGNASDAARLKETARSIHDAVEDTTAEILDLGCAAGGLLHELQELGHVNLTGLDPSRDCASYAHSQFGLKVLVGSLFSPPAMGEFDCVILSHVLEHVQDLRQAFSVIAGLVREGGLLYLEVPDAARYSDFVVAPFQDFSTEHINHFASQSIDALAGMFGFSLEHVGKKTIELADAVPYPALFGFWRKSAARFTPSSLGCSDDFVSSIRRYIELSDSLLADMDARIGRALDGGAELVVWGTGQLTMKLLAETRLGGGRIAFFVDSNPINWGRTLRGVPISSPERLIGNSRIPILIGSIWHQKSIAARIRSEMGLQNEIITLA